MNFNLDKNQDSHMLVNLFLLSKSKKNINL